MRWVILVGALALSACAPGAAHMRASEASAWLETFAADAAPESVCTTAGRATLREAVRAYGAAMAQGGVVWPNVGAANTLTSVEASVLIATASGLVDVADLQAAARSGARSLPLGAWPAIGDLHKAARLACGDLVQLQQTAARLVIERDRYRLMSERANADARAAQRLARQQARLQRSMAEIEMISERITSTVQRSRRAS